MKNIYIYILFLFWVFVIPAQAQNIIKGRLLRSIDSVPIPQAVIITSGNFVGTISSFTGEFLLKVDSLHKKVIIKKSGYLNDTLIVDSMIGKYNTIYMEILPVVFPEFVFHVVRAPKVDAYERRKQWSYVLDRPRPGLQSPISYFYDRYSKRGRELQKLEEMFERDEKKRVVESVFTREVAHQISGLSGDALDSFINFCGPTYNLVSTTSEYEIIESIKRCYKLHQILFKKE